MAEVDVMQLEKQGVNRETVENWSAEQRAMEVDITLLKQVEALERKVISARLQVKVHIISLTFFQLLTPHTTPAFVY